MCSTTYNRPTDTADDLRIVRRSPDGSLQRPSGGMATSHESRWLLNKDLNKFIVSLQELIEAYIEEPKAALKQAVEFHVMHNVKVVKELSKSEHEALMRQPVQLRNGKEYSTYDNERRNMNERQIIPQHQNINEPRDSKECLNKDGPPVSVNQSFYWHHDTAEFKKLLPYVDRSRYEKPKSTAHNSGTEPVNQENDTASKKTLAHSMPIHSSDRYPSKRKRHSSASTHDMDDMAVTGAAASAAKSDKYPTPFGNYLTPPPSNSADFGLDPISTVSSVRSSSLSGDDIPEACQLPFGTDIVSLIKAPLKPGNRKASSGSANPSSISNSPVKSSNSSDSDGDRAAKRSRRR